MEEQCQHHQLDLKTGHTVGPWPQQMDLGEDKPVRQVSRSKDIKSREENSEEN